MGLLPYLIVSFVIFVAILITLLIYARYTYLGYDCAHNKGMWCHNDWQCKTPCPNIAGGCFESTTGIAECLANQVAPTTTGNCDSTGCTCKIPANQGINCMAGCPLDLAAVPTGVVCRTK